MMTPLTLVIDREFPGVGRLKKATGTTIPAVKRKMSRMLTELYESGRLNLLRDIRDGRLTIMVVFDAWQRHALDELPSGKTAEPLATAMQAWIDKLEAGVDYSAQHITSFGTSLKYLTDAKLTGIEAPAVADLPALLEALRDALGKKHPRSFNLTRAAASAFVRATLKKKHPLWLAIQSVEPRKVPKRAPRPDLTVEWMRNTFTKPETDALDACAWAMALSGMGPKEYWGRWETLGDRIRIHGTKREARHREVPLVQPIAVPKLTRDAFRQRLEHRTDKRVTPYDFRRTYARWMEAAGIVRSRRVAYMGHAAGDVTALYERSEIDAYLAADAKKMQTWLGIEPSAPQPLRKVE